MISKPQIPLSRSFIYKCRYFTSFFQKHRVFRKRKVQKAVCSVLGCKCQMRVTSLTTIRVKQYIDVRVIGRQIFPTKNNAVAIGKLPNRLIRKKCSSGPFAFDRPIISIKIKPVCCPIPELARFTSRRAEKQNEEQKSETHEGNRAFQSFIHLN